ncbi:MAG: type IV pilus secretin PilQ, partial [Desulfobacteraceae bacterium]
LIVAAALLCLICGCAGTPETPEAEDKPPAPAVVQSVEYTSTPEEAAVTIQTSRKTEHKKPFSLLHPPRIYLDVKGTPGKDLSPLMTSDKGLVREIRVEKRLRGYTGIIVYLRHADYASRLITEGPDMTLVVTAASPEAEPQAAAQPPSPEVSPPGLPRVTDVKVTQRRGNRTRLTIHTEEPVDYDVKLDRRTLIIELENGTISPDLLKQLESEYARGAVSRINAFYAPQDRSVTLRVALRELLPYHLTQDGGVLHVDFDPLQHPPKPETPAPAPSTAQAPTPELRPAAPVAEPEPAPQRPVATGPDQGSSKGSGEFTQSRAGLFEATAKHYAGQRMSFDFVDTDIRNILKLIAEVANINIVWGSDVAGKISMRLDNVPWDQALEMILRPNGLSYQIEDDVLWVVKTKILRDMEIEERKRKSALLAEKRRQGFFEAKIIEFITIKHRKADSIFKMLVGDENADPPILGALELREVESEEQEEGEEEKGGKTKLKTSDLLLSYDSGTNTIIANGVRAKVDKVKELIAKLDTPEKQVMIEARIVEATTDFARDLGIQWQNLDTGEPGIRREWYNRGSNFDGSGSFSTNAPSGWAANIGLAFGWLTEGGLGSLALDASLALGESDGKAHIVSAPKVLTVNGGEAYIARGVVDYFPVATEDRIGYEMLEALLSLLVKPTVSADDSHVNMVVEVKDEKPRPGEVRRFDTGEGEEDIFESPPGKSTKEIRSTLIVGTGETVVIGGIFQKSEQTTDRGVPWLKDIPFLGWLFKAERSEEDRTELLIFLTPSVVNPVDQRKS